MPGQKTYPHPPFALFIYIISIYSLKKLSTCGQLRNVHGFLTYYNSIILFEPKDRELLLQDLFRTQLCLFLFFLFCPSHCKIASLFLGNKKTARFFTSGLLLLPQRFDDQIAVRVFPFRKGVDIKASRQGLVNYFAFVRRHWFKLNTASSADRFVSHAVCQLFQRFLPAFALIFRVQLYHHKLIGVFIGHHLRQLLK